MTAPSLHIDPTVPDEILEAGKNGDLVLFVGSGISQLGKLPSWKGFAEKVLDSLQDAELLNFDDLAQLKTLDPKKQLSIAELIAAEKKFDLNLSKYFASSEEAIKVYADLNRIGSVCVTTNYDELLAPVFDPTKRSSTADAAVSTKSTKRVFRSEELLIKHANEPGTVIHLHGSISDPKSMIVSTKRYLEHYETESVRDFLTELFAKKVVLFLGYGLDEFEVLEHILRKGEASKSKERKRFALQGYLSSEESLYKRLLDYYEHSFGVHVIGFRRDAKNYHEQVAILKDWAEKIEVRSPPMTSDLDFINEVLGDEAA